MQISFVLIILILGIMLSITSRSLAPSQTLSHSLSLPLSIFFPLTCFFFSARAVICCPSGNAGKAPLAEQMSTTRGNFSLVVKTIFSNLPLSIVKWRLYLLLSGFSAYLSKYIFINI